MNLRHNHVSIIIVNWNGFDLLSDCLESINEQTYDNYEVIFVDNASSDNSVEFVRRNYPSVNVIKLTENTGFTGGNIAGLKVAAGGTIVLLNNDTVLTERWLEIMMEGLYSDPSIGLCSARIVIAGTTLIDSVGDTFTSAFSGTKMGEYEPAERYLTRQLVPGACAAAVIYKRSMLEQIGFFDEDFFFNHEDTDLNLRAWFAGWKCLYVPEAIVYHKVNASVGFLSDFGVYHFARNSSWVWIKNLPVSFMIRSLPSRILYEMSSLAFFCFIKGKWKPFLRGKLDALRGFGKMWRKRREVLPHVRVTYSDISFELMPVTQYLRMRLKSMPK